MGVGQVSYSNLIKSLSAGQKGVNNGYSKAGSPNPNLPGEVGSDNPTGANMGPIEEGPFAGDAVFNNRDHQIHISKDGLLTIGDRDRAGTDPHIVPNSVIDLKTLLATDYFGTTRQLENSVEIDLDDGTHLYLEKQATGEVVVTLTNRWPGSDGKNGNFLCSTVFSAAGQPLTPIGDNSRAETFEKNFRASDYDNKSNWHDDNPQRGKAPTIYINNVTKDKPAADALRASGDMNSPDPKVRQAAYDKAYGKTFHEEEDVYDEDSDGDRRGYFVPKDFKGVKEDGATRCARDDVGGTWVTQGGLVTHGGSGGLDDDNRYWGSASCNYKEVQSSVRVPDTQPMPTDTSLSDTPVGANLGGAAEAAPTGPAAAPSYPPQPAYHYNSIFPADYDFEPSAPNEKPDDKDKQPRRAGVFPPSPVTVSAAHA